MRITEFLSDSTFRKQLQAGRADMMKFNNEVVTGKKITKASDDSTAFTSGKLFEDIIRRNEQFEKNVNSGLFQARGVQDSLSQMQDIMISIKNLATEAANDVKGGAEREGLARQMQGLKQDLIEAANVKFNDLYLFAGTNSNEKPFFEDAASAGGVGTSSTDRPLKVLVGDASIVNTTISGIDLRQMPTGDLFEAIESSIQAMENDNTAGISNSIEQISEGVDHLIGLSTKTASNINRLEFTNEQLESNLITQKGELSRLTDADITESILNFQNAQSTLETAMAVQSRMMQTTLLNFLR